jgi:hypothetical protein
MTVEGCSPGQVLRLPAGGGTVNVSWQVESTSVPIEQVEIVVGGRAVDGAGRVDGAPPYRASGVCPVRVSGSTWVAVRVRGSYRGRAGDIAAHTSVVQVLVGDQPLFSPSEAAAVLKQIEGVAAYVDELAPRTGEAQTNKLRASLLSAHALLHARLHAAGVAHQ